MGTRHPPVYPGAQSLVPMRTAVPLILLSIAACSGAPARQPAPEPVAEGGAVNAAELRRDLYAFADDSMRGRETGTEDADRAARFLADRVQRLGLEPAGDSLYLQRVPLERERFAPASYVEVERRGVRIPLRIGRDVIPLINLGDGIPPTRRSAAGPVVFAGYALPAVAGDELEKLPIEGSVVIVVNGAPPGADSATRARSESQAAISARLARILPRGPSAVIVLLEGAGRAVFAQSAPQLERGVTARTNGTELAESERPLPLIMLGVADAGSPLLPAGWQADARPRVLDGVRLTARFIQERAPVVGYNVVAVVRGSDPVLSRTYVAFGAHYDHIGIVAPVNGDSIANGADDDGSGSVALLAIARAMQQARVKPKRSMLFVWHVGEEKGLLGSAWFTMHATVPVDSIVAQLNADMIGRGAARALYLVGPRSAPNAQSRRLGAIVDSVNAAEPRPFVVDRSFDSPSHPEHIYERSDHFNYARQGIPIVFFTTGLHDDYHMPSDEASKIDYEKLARVARLIANSGVAVANSERRPR